MLIDSVPSVSLEDVAALRANLWIALGVCHASQSAIDRPDPQAPIFKKYFKLGHYRQPG
jgi:hypothetical protein